MRVQSTAGLGQRLVLLSVVHPPRQLLGRVQLPDVAHCILLGLLMEGSSGDTGKIDYLLLLIDLGKTLMPPSDLLW